MQLVAFPLETVRSLFFPSPNAPNLQSSCKCGLHVRLPSSLTIRSLSSPWRESRLWLQVSRRLQVDCGSSFVMLTRRILQEEGPLALYRCLPSHALPFMPFIHQSAASVEQRFGRQLQPGWLW